MTDREWIFDRYRDGKLMAEGARVHASNEKEALEKAHMLFDYEQCTFKTKRKLDGAQ